MSGLMELLAKFFLTLLVSSVSSDIHLDVFSIELLPLSLSLSYGHYGR